MGSKQCILSVELKKMLLMLTSCPCLEVGLDDYNKNQDQLFFNSFTTILNVTEIPLPLKDNDAEL